MSIKGLHHVGLFVTDVERSRKFYIEGLGGKEVFSFPLPGDASKTIYLVDVAGGAVVEIIPRGSEEPEERARWAHICLECSDVKAAYDLALSAGAVTRSAPADVMLGDKPATNAFVYGPEGEVIEFFRERG